MLHRFRLPVFVAAAALLAGCFQIESVLSVNPDGSAELTETVSAGGMMGVFFRKAALEIAPGDDRSEQYGDGVTVRSVDVQSQPGRAIVSTVYAVPDVSAFHYDISQAVDMGDLLGEAMTGGLGGSDDDGFENDELDDDGFETADDGSDTSPYRFAFAPGTGGAPARLTVTIPEVNALPDADSDMGLFKGMSGGMGGNEEDESIDDALVVMGDMRMRFSVRADGIESASAGWVEGGGLTLADIDMGTFLQFAASKDETLKSLEASFGPAADGYDLPGYRMAPTGVTTIELR